MITAPHYHLDLAATNWQLPAYHPKLKAGEVHAWRLPLNSDKHQLARLVNLLTLEERQYAELSYFERGYRERVMSRATLRILLGYYLNKSPEEVKLASTKLRKPYLVDFPELHFNVSHASDHLLLAFTKIAAIGVDLEFIDPKINVTSLVERFFSRVEVPVILGLKPADQSFAFFRAWTRKEAIIKATGNGLSTPLDEFGVSIDLAHPVQVLHTDWNPLELEEWQLRSFTVTEYLPGAIALKGKISRVRYLNFALPVSM